MIQPQRGFQRRQRDFADAQGTLEWVLLQTGNEIFFTDNNPGLRPTQQFITGEGHQINTGGNQVLRHRFGWQAVLRHVDQRATAQIGRHRNVVFVA
ncbi:hypothetical protein D3C80_1797470 [compost metagenome]